MTSTDGKSATPSIYKRSAPAARSSWRGAFRTGPRKQVTVPKAANDERVIGASNGQLALQAVLGCGGGQSLFWFDPTTAKETPLLGPSLNGGGVLTALPYPGLQP